MQRCLATVLLVATAAAIVAAHATSLPVPDIVHQTYDYRSPNFFLYLSLCCVQHYLRPARHILWVNDEGRHNKGLWEGWKRQAAPGSWEAHLAHWLAAGVVETRFLTFPASPPGNASIFVSNKAHRSDFVRMHALQVFGGMYLDTDAFPIRPLTELRCGMEQAPLCVSSSFYSFCSFCSSFCSFLVFTLSLYSFSCSPS